MTTKQIEIVGGGIAGLSLAIALQSREVPVVLKEAGSYPRHRLCGEFVNGVSEETLSYLRLTGLFSEARVHQEMTWWQGDDLVAQSRLARPVPALSRWSMDQWLSERFLTLGGELQCHQRADCQARPGLVWTAGRKLQQTSEWLGLKAHFRELETHSGLEMHLGQDGYLGLTPVEGGRVNVCGLFHRRKDLPGKGSEKLLAYLRASGLDRLAQRLAQARVDESSLTGISGIQFGDQGQDTELLALGDAERMIPSFTGNGMSMAFEAAECAVQPLLAYATGQREWEAARSAVQSALARRFKRRVALAKGMHRFVLHSPEQDLLTRLAKPGFLPFSFLNRILT